MDLFEFLKHLWLIGRIDNTIYSISMIPNILQLAGAILTLLTAVLGTFGLLDTERKNLQKLASMPKGLTITVADSEIFTKKNIPHSEMVYKINKLKEHARELSYAGLGIFLIVCGYISAVTGLDFTDNLSFYFICLIILFLIIYYYLFKYRKLYRDKINSGLSFYIDFLPQLFGLMTLLFLVLMYFFKWFAITLSFLGSTLLLIFFVIKIIKNVNIVIEKGLKLARKR